MTLLGLFVVLELIKDTLVLVYFGLKWLSERPKKEGELENFKVE